jgi:TAG lipase/steryl ester hydrolase/phospholipase A2/LPA acyltransferase
MTDVASKLIEKYALLGTLEDVLGKLVSRNSLDKAFLVCSHHFYELIDLIFGFKRFAKQLALIVILQAAISTGRLTIGTIWRFLYSFTKKGAALKLLHKQLRDAETYSAWLQVAMEIDKLTGKDEWRREEASPLFDHKVLKKRIQDIKRLIDQGDVFTLLFRLRGGVSRDQFGMQNDGLFKKALSGPKLVVEQYHYTVCEALDFVCNTEDETVPIDAKLAFFNETRHAYGRTALLVGTAPSCL